METILILEDRPYSVELEQLKNWLFEEDFISCIPSGEIEIRDDIDPTIIDEFLLDEIEAKRKVFCLIVDVMLDRVKEVYVSGGEPIITRNYDAGITYIREVARSGKVEFERYRDIPILIWTAREWQNWLPKQFMALERLSNFAPIGYAWKGEKEERQQILDFFIKVKKFNLGDL